MDEQGITYNKLNTMEESYTVAWSIVNDCTSLTEDYWERCETLEEAQELYNMVTKDCQLYTASIAKEIQSTEA